MRYSGVYWDDTHEFMHVILPKRYARYMPMDRLLAPPEWRPWLSVNLPPGWEHYAVHRPERHVLLLRRKRRPVAATRAAAPVDTQADTAAAGTQ